MERITRHFLKSRTAGRRAYVARMQQQGYTVRATKTLSGFVVVCTK